jgi:hypothetical protein
LKDGSKNSRPGNPDYGITEEIKAFKIVLTLKQGLKLATVTDDMRTKITSGKQKYTAYMNDTCAETARDLLSDAGISTPSGSGAVKYSSLIDWPVAYATNPYMWHKNFKASGHAELSGKLRNPDPSKLIGSGDPLLN